MTIAAVAGIDPAKYPHINLGMKATRPGLEGTPRYVRDRYGDVGDVDTGLFVPTWSGDVPLPVQADDIAATAKEQVDCMWGWEN